MKASLYILILAGALAAGCSRNADAPAAPESAAQPVEAPATPESEPLAPELAARLIRPHSPILGPTNAPVTIVEFLDLTRDSAVLVCGDTTAHAKPHPLPLQHAAREAGFSVERCVYVGDDLRDIQAAHAAGMPAVAAAYGYVGEDDNITTWEAETCANSPADNALTGPCRSVVRSSVGS